MIFGFARKQNIFLLQHYHPIRHIHCQIAASGFPTDFDSWDMFTIICSRSPTISQALYTILILWPIGMRTYKLYLHVKRSSLP